MAEVFWISAVCDADFRTAAAAHAPRVVEEMKKFTLEQAIQAYTDLQRKEASTCSHPSSSSPARPSGLTATGS